MSINRVERRRWVQVVAQCTVAIAVVRNTVESVWGNVVDLQPHGDPMNIVQVADHM